MKRKIVTMNQWFCTIWGISTAFLFLSEGVNNMEWWQTLLVTVIPAVISTSVTWLISRKSQINKNTHQIDKLIERIGVRSDKTLQSDISDKFENIISDIGRSDEGSLTKQHDIMKNMLAKGIEVSERRYKEQEERIRYFTSEQHNMNENLEKFRLFLESWQRMAETIRKMNIRISQLEEENQHLKQRINEPTKHKKR